MGWACDALQLRMCAQAQALEDSATLAVDFHHVQLFDEELAGVIQREHYRVEPALRKARPPCLPNPTPPRLNLEGQAPLCEPTAICLP